MRDSQQGQSGSTGQYAVSEDFARIGWGPVPNAEHDLGTDLLVHARDARRFERGLIVGVQVKAGPAFFSRPKKDNGEISGWWYSESGADHFDDWVAHGLPHLLVLHDLEERVSFWVHVTAEAVKSTGRGCKILVPRAQTLDEVHADDLFAVACKQKAAPAIEGTALLGAPGGIPPARKLRHALIAPRLIAPHPSARYESSVDATEAIGLLAQGRFHDLLRFAENHRHVPDPKDAASSPSWLWRFVAAIWDWATADSVELLTAVHSSADTNDRIAASGVVLACALRRIEQHDTALGVLDESVRGDGLSPVDHGWVLTHRSRIKSDAGDLAGSIHDAAEAQRNFAGDQDDITVSALVAAAAWQLFANASLLDFNSTDYSDPEEAERQFREMERSFNETLTASDTAVSWWRSQAVSRGLGDALDKRFENWAEDQAEVLFQMDGPATHHLFAAELSSDLTGEHQSWCELSSLSARQRLMGVPSSPGDVADLAEGLSALRRSGDHKSLKLALSRIYRDGPVIAVAKVMGDIPLDGWTHTTAASNLEALAQAGDFVCEPDATKLALKCAESVGNAAMEIEEVIPPWKTPMSELDAATGLLPAAGAAAHSAIASAIAIQSESPPHLSTNWLVKAISRLNFDLVDYEARNAMWSLAQRGSDPLSVSALGWLASHDFPGARAEAMSRASSSDVAALDAVHDVSEFDSSSASVIIEQLVSRADQTLASARKGSFTLGGFNAGYALAVMNMWFPSRGGWKKSIEYLCDPHVAWRDKQPICDLIAWQQDRLPTEVRIELAANINLITTATAGVQSAADTEGSNTLLAVALGALSGEDANAEAAKLALGTPTARRNLALLLGMGQCPAMQPMLISLIGDPEPSVRSDAAFAVGKLAATDSNGQVCPLAWELAKRDGTLLPMALLDGLSRARNPGPEATRVAKQFQRHASARIRGKALRLLAR